jgi:hypothetical protein
MKKLVDEWIGLDAAQAKEVVEVESVSSLLQGW